MLKYLETFYRHRLLAISPLVLALVASLGLVLTQPRTYEATAAVRFAASASDGTSAAAGNGTPADQGNAQLAQLLKTRSFDAKVGRRGPLASDLVARNAAGDLGSNLVRLLRGTGSGSLNDPDVLDDLLRDTLSQKTNVVSVGPQVVSVSFDYPDAAVAAETTQAIVDQLSVDLTAIRRDQAQALSDFYKLQVDRQAAEVSAADARVAQYFQAHPGQQRAGATPDVALVSLQQSDDLDRLRYQDLLGKYDQAQADLAQTNQPGAAGFRVVDPPTVPYRSKGLIKAVALGGIAGLVVGLVLMLITLMALTASDSSARRPEEMELQLGRRVVGTIPRLR